ncbi:MAG: hypothetical protein ABI467_05895 [Kofleriaceae bacterium]
MVRSPADNHERDELRDWLARGLAYSATLPPKHRKPVGKRPKPRW